MSLAQLDALLAAYKSAAPSEPETLLERRASWEAAAARYQPDDVMVERIAVGAAWIERIAPRDRMPDASQAIIFAHGGAYVSGSPATHRRLTTALARRFGGEVWSLDYRLAPEHPYPAAVEDMLAAAALLRGRGVRRLVLAGDSAGGGLALSALLALRDRGEAQPAGVWVISPWTDLTLRSGSIGEKAAVDPVLQVDRLAESAAAYAGGRALADPVLSSAFADAAGLAPALIHVGSREIFIDDALMLARRYALADRPVTLRIWPGMVHSFVALAGLLDEADAAIEEALAWIAGLDPV